MPGTGPYLAGEVEGEEYTCGVFTVPQNWDEPDGRYIDLGFVVAHARSENPAPDPLVSLEGGPGASAVFRDNISRYEMVRADRDIIKLDIRGVGLSQRTGYEECLVLALQNGAPAEQIEALQTTVGAAELLRYAGFESSVQVSAQPDIPLLNGICWDQFAAQGLDLNQFRSADFARDAVELVKALGHDSFNVEGTSYGTRLAMTILADIPSYPDAPDLRAVILDSPMPPSTYVVVSQPRREHDFLLEFLDDCVSDLACNTAYPNLDERLTALMDQLEQEPLTVGAETVTLDDFLARLNGWGGSTRAEYIPLMIAELEMGMLDTYLGLRDGKIDTRDPEDPPLDMSDPIVMFIVEGQALLNGTDAQFFPDIISQALNEDDPLTLLETAIPQLYPDVADELLVLLATMTEEDMANSAYLAQLPQADTKIEDSNAAQFRFRAAEPYFVHSTVHCAEDILYERYEDALNTYNDLRYPRVGTLEFAQVETARCENYPVEVAPIEIKNPVDSPVPTLVLMAAYDKQTPPFMARRAARELENSTLVRVPQAGHGAWNTADRCVGQIVAAYIQNPDAALDLSCLDAREPQWVYPEESLSAVPGELPAELVAQLDAWLNSQVYTEGGNPTGAAPGLILLIDTPEGRYLEAAGVSSLEEGTPMQVDDRLEIGSNTKSFTVVLLMQLQEEGVLSLDDKLSQWLPELAAQIPNGDEVTLYQLANHISGIPDYTGLMGLGLNDPEKLAQGYTPEELVQYAIDNAQTEFAPGEGWNYNNTGYVLLGLVAEAATGQSLGELYQERIFDPLGLETAILVEGNPREGELDSQGYFQRPSDGELVNSTQWNASQGWAAGAIAMTAEDLAAYAIGLAGGELFEDPDSLAQMLTFNEAAAATLAAYGLGLLHVADGYWGHEGATPAFQSLWGINPDKGTLVVGLTNSYAYSAANLVNGINIIEGRGAQPFRDAVFYQAGEADPESYATWWQWVQMTDASTETDINLGNFLTLRRDNAAVLQSATCGPIQGTFSATAPDAIVFDMDASDVTCPDADPLMKLLGMLDTVASWRYENGGLVLVLEDGTELTFRPPG